MSSIWNEIILTIFFFTITVYLLNLASADGIFTQHELVNSNDRTLDVTEIITCLATIYENLAMDHPGMVNVPQCVDMCLNWLLNVYDTWVEKFLTHSMLGPYRIEIAMDHLGMINAGLM